MPSPTKRRTWMAPAVLALAFVAVGYLLGLELESMLLGYMSTCVLFLVGIAALTSFSGSAARQR